MAKIEIRNNVYYLGQNDWDRKFFDALIPLPHGTSYNSYVVVGKEKTAIIDTVETENKEEFLNDLKHLGLTKLDYIISNHAEQDHSGMIKEILCLYPDAKILTNPKCKDLLLEFHEIAEDKIEIVLDRQNISLGDKTLEFIYAPWVHWPDNMFVYLKEDKILFSSDFLGSHFASESLFVESEKIIYDAAKRYYAQIMMPFKNNVKINLEKVKNLEVDIIAPSHGPLYNNPKFIIDAYEEWVSEKIEKKVIIAYTSMHGSTSQMVDHIVNKLMEKGVKVRPFNLLNSDIGDLAMEVLDASTIIIGSPTFLTGAHPLVTNFANLINILKPKTKYVAIIGSYGWAGKMVESVRGMLGNLKAEELQPAIIKGCLKKDNIVNLDRLIEEIYERNKN